MFRVTRYAADGCSDAPRVLGTAPTLSAARRLVRTALGLRRLSPTRHYVPSPDVSPLAVEGWNVRPPSHSSGWGCPVIEIEQGTP